MGRAFSGELQINSKLLVSLSILNVALSTAVAISCVSSEVRGIML